MSNPVLKKNRNRIIYLIIWAIIIMAHTFFLYFFYDHELGCVLTESLVYNILFLLLGIGLWYIVRYNDFEIKRLPNLIAGHALSAIILIALWITIARYLIKMLVNDPEFIKFSVSLIPAKIAFGIFYYLVIILIYYLLIYYENFREKMKKEATREMRYKEAELHALKSQINPHFIFNSLNSISSLTISDPEKAQEMLVKLSEFLRLTLKHDQGQLVELKEELRFISLYLEIEKVRFGEKLSFKSEIRDDHNKTSIPHMILQPLIENAVKHGIMESIHPVEIKLSAYWKDSMLVLRIENQFDPDHKVKGEGIGLRNVRDRLKLMYGLTDLLEIKTENNVFRAEIKIPVNKDQP